MSLPALHFDNSSWLAGLPPITVPVSKLESGGSLSGGTHVWKGFPSGRLIVGCGLFSGEAMANDGVFRIVAEHVGQEKSEFTIDLVKIDFQRRR